MDSNRFIVVANTNEVKNYTYKGFEIIRGDERFMYSELIGTRYYNVKNDEFMKNDLYTKTSTKILNPFYEFITADFILRTIYANNLPRTENVKSKKP